VPVKRTLSPVVEAVMPPAPSIPKEATVAVPALSVIV
jgi:hypothetical protein